MGQLTDSLKEQRRRERERQQAEYTRDIVVAMIRSGKHELRVEMNGHYVVDCASNMAAQIIKNAAKAQEDE
jgi:hypothetical protein